MATKLSIKPPKKTQKTKSVLITDEKFTGDEVKWTSADLNLPPNEFDNKLRLAFNFYNYYFDQKHLRKYVVQWLKTNTEISADNLSKYIKTAEKTTPFTVCALCKAQTAGMPFKERHRQYVIDEVNKVISAYIEEPINDVKIEIRKPTIQDRLNEKLGEIIGYFEGIYDELILGEESAEPDAYKYFQTEKVPQIHVNKISSFYQKRKEELIEAESGLNSQLKEAYAHYKKKDFKKYITFIDKLLEDIANYAQVKKTTRKVRAKKAPSKEKLVSKVKYLKEEKTLKAVSINPADILGAQIAWLYNVKTRKLYKILADSTTGPLSIKGTTITGFDELKSIGKTVRKPEITIPEFLKSSKIALRKFLEDIRATEIKFNGRLNADMLILKVQ